MEMNENVNNVEEVNDNEHKVIDYDSKTLCSVIPLMLCRIPFNPVVINWEDTQLDKLVGVRDELLQVRYALITSKDINEIQKIQQFVDDQCVSYMTQLGFGDLALKYEHFINEINKDSHRNHPSEFRQFLLLNDVITIYDWIIVHLKYYREIRSIHTVEESIKILRSVVFNGEIFDDAEIEESNGSWAPRNEVFDDEHWDGSEDIENDMIREKIIDDNNNFINNPDNISEDDLRKIINSFNDDHSVSGLLDD